MPVDDTTAVSVTRLAYHYGPRRALDEITFDIDPGEFTAILGPNGGGKTTLFRIIATLATPTSGEVTVFGDDVVAARNRVRHHLGVVFQAPALDVKLSVRENLLHHGHLHGLSGRPLRAQLNYALERLELDDRRHDLVETLSGGLKRRVELAKVMMTQPRLLLLDEPTTGLDPVARDSFWRLIMSLREDTQAAVLYTTHLLEEAEDSGRVLILDRGRIVADGAPASLRAQIAGQVVHLKGRDLAALRERLQTAFSLEAEIEGDSVRVAVTDGGEFAARVGQVLGDAIDSLQIARPSLYDVFRQRTGHAFSEEGGL
jgi:ABC-2 type transport system ATP-binding protein